MSEATGKDGSEEAHMVPCGMILHMDRAQQELK